MISSTLFLDHPQKAEPMCVYHFRYTLLALRRVKQISINPLPCMPIVEFQVTAWVLLETLIGRFVTHYSVPSALYGSCTISIVNSVMCSKSLRIDRPICLVSSHIDSRLNTTHNFINMSLIFRSSTVLTESQLLSPDLESLSWICVQQWILVYSDRREA